MAAQARRKVRLNAKDWERIYSALRVVAASTETYLAASAHYSREYVARWPMTAAKIGVNGMAARDRGVAPVTKATR